MKYIYLSIFLFALTCSTPKKEAEKDVTMGETKTDVTQIKEEPKIKEKELIVVLKNAATSNDVKSLITNSGLTWSDVVYDKNSTKMVVIKVPEDKSDFWIERLNTSGEFKTVTNNSKETLAELIKKAETTFLSFRKTECLGDCPTYDLTIDEEGNVVFKGVKYVNETGERKFKLTDEEFTTLKDNLAKSNFSTYKKSYDDPNIMDLPSTFISYKGQQVQIRLWKEIPKDLINVHEYIEGILLDKKFFD